MAMELDDGAPDELPEMTDYDEPILCAPATLPALSPSLKGPPQAPSDETAPPIEPLLRRGMKCEEPGWAAKS